MKGLSPMNCTASTSRNIFAVRSAMTWASGKLAVMAASFSECVCALVSYLAQAAHPIAPARYDEPGCAQNEFRWWLDRSLSSQGNRVRHGLHLSPLAGAKPR